MGIILAGINYRTAPVEIRERFSVATDQLKESLLLLADQSAIVEVILVSTCNRTEVYAVTNDMELGSKQIMAFLEHLSGLTAREFHADLYVRQGLDAVSHLHRVVTGLDSMVIGETQILGQVRSAFLFAQSLGTTGTFFNQLFRDAIAFGKRVQAETGIGQSAVSVSYAAVTLTRKVFSDLGDKTVLVLGAGKMADLTLTHLQAQGVSKILMANRTFARAEAMAERYGGRPLPLAQLGQALCTADIVITSASGRDYLVAPPMVAQCMAGRGARPLFLIDIAVPRNIDPAVAHLDGVYLYDIDDLQDVVASGLAIRKQEADRVLAMIEGQVALFSEWLAGKDAVPLIAQLQQKAFGIQHAVYDSLVNKLPDLDERQRRILHKHTVSIVNQILRDPIASIKVMALEDDGAAALQTFARIFGLQSHTVSVDAENDAQASDAQVLSSRKGYMISAW